jgi:hypothetical protein
MPVAVPTRRSTLSPPQLAPLPAPRRSAAAGSKKKLKKKKLQQQPATGSKAAAAQAPRRQRTPSVAGSCAKAAAKTKARGASSAAAKAAATAAAAASGPLLRQREEFEEFLRQRGGGGGGGGGSGGDGTRGYCRAPAGSAPAPGAAVRQAFSTPAAAAPAMMTSSLSPSYASLPPSSMDDESVVALMRAEAAARETERAAGDLERELARERGQRQQLAQRVEQYEELHSAMSAEIQRF